MGEIRLPSATQLDNLTIKGKSLDGLPKEISALEGVNSEYILRVNEAAPVAYNSNTDTLKIENSLQGVVVFADNLEIRNTELVAIGTNSKGVPPEELRRYKNFVISINNTHDQPATIEIFGGVGAVSLTSATSRGGLLYSEANVLPANTGRLVFTPTPQHESCADERIHLPSLQGLYSSLAVSIKFSTPPTTGSLSIVMEMN